MGCCTSVKEVTVSVTVSVTVPEAVFEDVLEDVSKDVSVTVPEAVFEDVLEDVSVAEMIALPAQELEPEGEVKAETIVIPDIHLTLGGHTPLASGNFGTVFKTCIGGQTVVFKEDKKMSSCPILSPEYHARKTAVIREGELMTRLAHPNVMPLIGISNSFTTCLVMPFVEDNLEKLLKSNPDMKVQKRLRLLVDVACGLEHCHDMGIVHRDIATRNILVDNMSRAVITDFGLARQLETGLSRACTETLVVPKTSPRESRTSNGVMYSPKSDVFMFAILCHEVLTGRSLHVCQQAKRVINCCEVLTSFEPLLFERPALISNELWEMMKSCWDMDPDMRPDMSIVLSVLKTETVTVASMEVGVAIAHMCEEKAEVVEIHPYDMPTDVFGSVAMAGPPTDVFGSVAVTLPQGGMAEEDDLWANYHRPLDPC